MEMIQETNQKNSHVPYKYRLLELLDQLPHKENRIAMKRLPSVLGVHSTTFSDWRYIKQDSGRMIPADILYKIATFFDVDVKQMYTEPPKSINYEDVIADYDESKKKTYNV